MENNPRHCYLITYKINTNKGYSYKHGKILSKNKGEKLVDDIINQLDKFTENTDYAIINVFDAGINEEQPQ